MPHVRIPLLGLLGLGPAKCGEATPPWHLEPKFTDGLAIHLHAALAARELRRVDSPASG
jgi:hypothetical protein